MCMNPSIFWLQANLFKAEKEKLARALTKELGEDTPLSKALEGSGDWRGRAQQISLLKAKINELQQAQVSRRQSSILVWITQ